MIEIVCFANSDCWTKDFLVETLHVLSNFCEDVWPHEHAIFCGSMEVCWLVITGNSALAEDLLSTRFKAHLYAY